MTEEYLNINKLVKRLKKDEKNSNEQFYYRGQIHDWPIKSSISRSDYNEKEIQSTSNFLKWLSENKAIPKKDENEYMAIAQHYGYKTDLIDFTKSIDVAAFFATDGVNVNDEIKESYGVIWRISENDVKEITEIIKLILNNSREKDGNRILKYLSDHDYSPFIEVSIPEMSRINNQQGIFLWDIHNIVTNFYLKSKKPNFRFKHDGKVYSNKFINQSLIYPKPNSLENEIIRYEYSKSVMDFQDSNRFREFLKSAIILEENNNIISDYIDKLVTYEWSSEFGSINSHFSMKIEKNKIIKYDYEKNTILKVIEKNIDEITEGITTFIDFEEESLNNLINNEVIDVLKYSNYSPKEILFIILEILDQYKKAKNLTLVSDFEFFKTNYRKSSFLEKLYEEELLYISFSDKNGVQSYAYIPYNLIKIKMNLIKNNIQKLIMNDFSTIEKLENYDDFNIFMSFNRNPQKIFEFDEIKNIFIKYILPYQFICRNRNARIYVPTYLKRFGPE